MTHLSLLSAACCLLLFSAGCQVESPPAPSAGETPTEAVANTQANVLGGGERAPSVEDVEAARRDTSWREFAARNAEDAPRSNGRAEASQSTRRPADRPSLADTAAYASALALPLSGDVEGRAVLYAQILLDRARFSPGQIDGRWGQNTEKAIYWLQHREGLGATGTLDRPTLHRLVQLADAPAAPDSLVVLYTLTADDVEGPFNETPDDVYEQAEMDRLTYQSLAEKLGEDHHVAPALLREWHGGALDSLAVGDTLRVPHVGRSGISEGAVDHLVISDGGRYLHALDAQGRILYHFPSTLGSDYDPSPSDTLRIVGIAEDPSWHYQPAILEGVDDREEDAFVPPGPNNSVGIVWMELSKEHYGIHGTAHPETIGHTASAGCVRLTNWDVQTLAEHVRAGTVVAFRDRDGRSISASERPGSTGAPTP